MVETARDLQIGPMVDIVPALNRAMQQLLVTHTCSGSAAILPQFSYRVNQLCIVHESCVLSNDNVVGQDQIKATCGESTT